MKDGPLSLWTVYCFPRDFAQHYVVRIHRVMPDGGQCVAPVACLYDTLEEAMFDCETKGLAWIGRQPGDERRIVGVWV